MLPFGMYIVAVIVILLTFICWRFYQWRRKLPPGPPCLPLLGNLGMVDFSNSIAEFSRLRKKYGDVFCFVIGPRPVVVVNGAEALREMFVENADVTSVRPADFPLTKEVNGKGIIASNGELWREHRYFALKSLRDFGYGKRSLESLIQPQVETLLQKLGETNGKPFNMNEPLQFCIANVISSITMGKIFYFNDENLLSLMAFVDRIFADTTSSGVSSFIPFREYIPGDPFHVKERKQLMQKILDFLQEIIDEHKQTLNKDNIRDYVDAYLIEKDNRSGDPTSTFDEEQLIQTLRDFFFAGYETTVTALHWIMLQLIHNPDVQSRLKVEIEQVVGTSRLPSLTQRTELPYTEAVITETLRLNNIAPLAGPRGVLENVHWRGYLIPVGTYLIPNLDSVAMDPNIFPNPEKFDPERFLDENWKFIGQKELLPFGLGRRSCVGESLARMELFLFLTAIVQRFELLPEDTSNLPSLKGVLGITYSPLPYKVRVIPRD